MLELLAADPASLSSVRDPADAWRVHVEDSLSGLDLVGAPARLADVGSGAGFPGLVLAAALPDAHMDLIESNGRKCEFLRRWEREFPNLRVVEGRAEEQPTDGYGVAVAKALAPPVVAAEWCLPLVRPGGAAILWVGPTADVAAVERAAEQLGGGCPELRDGLLVLPKLEPTPAGFPRRPGMARKRPLA